MNRKHVGVWVALLGMMAALNGCVALVAGAAAGGATVSYVNNELHATVPAGIDKTWAAVKSAAQEIRYVKVSEKEDSMTGAWKGRNASDQPVTVELTRVTDNSTKIDIRVGTVSTSQNRAAAQLFYDKIVARL